MLRAFKQEKPENIYIHITRNNQNDIDNNEQCTFHLMHAWALQNKEANSSGFLRALCIKACAFYRLSMKLKCGACDLT